MIFFKIQVKEFTKQGSTRETGVKLRELLIKELNNHGLLELDLSGVLLTPSLADEAIGLFAKEIGKEQFKEKIKFVNINDEQKAIMVHVLSRRLSEGPLKVKGE